MKRFFTFLFAACALCLGIAAVPPEAFAQSTTRSVTKIGAPTSNQLYVPAFESVFTGPVYAENAVVLDSGKSIKFKISASGVVGSDAPIIRTGTGTPQGVVTAPIGSIFLRTNGVTDSTIYVKESGTGNTGWVPK